MRSRRTWRGLRRILVVGGSWACGALTGVAESAGTFDKRGAGWASPVPAAALREMTTDRPDATESPFTIDPGHVQIEMDLANYGRDDEGGGRATEWEAVPFNLRFGVRGNFELGVFVVPYRSETDTEAGRRVRRSGLGDTTLRAKWNFSGNDGGDTATGLIADVKLPTGERELSNGKLEGALTLPVAFPLGAGWSGAAMTSIEAVYAGADGYRPVWSNTVTAGRDLTDDLGGFVELTSSAGDGSHVATFNCGLTRGFGANTQWDVGVNVGLSEAAADLAVFVGVAQRF